MKEHGRLIRVRFNYEDGTEKELSGDEAMKWDEAVGGAVMNAWVHGCKLPDFPFKERKNELDESTAPEHP